MPLALESIAIQMSLDQFNSAMYLPEGERPDYVVRCGEYPSCLEEGG